MITIERPRSAELELRDGAEIGILLAAAQKYEKQLKGLSYTVKRHQSGIWYLAVTSPVLCNAWHDYGAIYVPELGGFTFVSTCQGCGKLANYVECQFCGYGFESEIVEAEVVTQLKLDLGHETLTDHERSK